MLVTILWYSIKSIKAEGNELTAQVTTDASSPWFAGHFPGDPILPGIAQLKMVADLITGSREEDLQVTGLSRIKFRKIVRPGELLDIHATPCDKNHQYAFRISDNSVEICSGMMFFAPKVMK